MRFSIAVALLVLLWKCRCGLESARMDSEVVSKGRHYRLGGRSHKGSSLAIDLRVDLK
jgi:hypothetical protein